VVLAYLDGLDGSAEPAARRLGAISALRLRSGLIPPPHFQSRIDRATALAGLALGEEAFARHWHSGHDAPNAVIIEALGQANFRDAAIASGNRPLSRRERQVLSLLAEGRSDREIAAALFISQRTVSTHVSAILRKLDSSTRAEAAVRAVRDGTI
jgi:DNA-binding NarL/FixJ family response regulator